MFLIYEYRDRVLGHYSHEVLLGYVKTEDEAKELCHKLNTTVAQKINEANKGGGFLKYYFKSIKYINSIDDVRV